MVGSTFYLSIKQNSVVHLLGTKCCFRKFGATDKQIEFDGIFKSNTGPNHNFLL